MANSVRLHKTVVQKSDLEKVVSKTFTTFVQPEVVSDTDSIEELFRLYDKFYLQIPPTGVNSHTYLIEESRKIVDITEDLREIQPLLDEISELRERVLQAQEEILELTVQLNTPNGRV